MTNRFNLALAYGQDQTRHFGLKGSPDPHLFKVDVTEMFKNVVRLMEHEQLHCWVRLICHGMLIELVLKVFPREKQVQPSSNAGLEEEGDVSRPQHIDQTQERGKPYSLHKAWISKKALPGAAKNFSDPDAGLNKVICWKYLGIFLAAGFSWRNSVDATLPSAIEEVRSHKLLKLSRLAFVRWTRYQSEGSIEGLSNLDDETVTTSAQQEDSRNSSENRSTTPETVTASHVLPSTMSRPDITQTCAGSSGNSA
jgi:hypothetical protein